MTTLPLTVCTQIVEPDGLEYHVDIINLGVPYDGRVYTLSDLSVLQRPANLYLRYVPYAGTIMPDRELSFSLGAIENLRLAGGSIRGTFKPNPIFRHIFNSIVESMNGKLILGIVAGVDLRPHRDITYAELTRVLGAQILMEDGHSLSDTRCGWHELASLIEHRACNSKLMSVAKLNAVYDNDFLDVVTACGFSPVELSEGDLEGLRKLYQEALAHYRVNPMLVGGPSELCNGKCFDKLHPKHVVYVKNQIIKQLRTERFKHVTATCY